MIFQSSFMLTTVKHLAMTSFKNLVERSDLGLADTGLLALGVGVMDE